jgi:hypothetical protein
MVLVRLGPLSFKYKLEYFSDQFNLFQLQRDLPGHLRLVWRQEPSQLLHLHREVPPQVHWQADQEEHAHDNLAGQLFKHIEYFHFSPGCVV